MLPPVHARTTTMTNLTRCLAAVLLLAAAPLATAQEGGARPAPAIGVVDITRVVENAPRFVEGSKKLEELAASLNKQAKEVSDRLKELKAQRDLAEGPIEVKKIELRLAVEQRHLDGLADLLRAEFGERQAKLVADCYADAERGIAAVAKEKGLQLVLRIGLGGGDDKVRTFDRRIVWYHTDEVDVTAAVIKHLQMAPAAPDAAAPAKSAEPAAQPAGPAKGS